MASLLDLTLEEIGLSGLEGCTLTQLWGHLSAHIPPLSLDLSSSSVREYVWSQILTFTKMVQIYKSPSPIPSQEPFSKYKLTDSDEIWEEFIPIHKHKMISDSVGGVKGSCTTYYERTNVTNEILSSSDKTLEAVEKRYGADFIVLVGSQSCRERSLIGSHLDPSLLPSDIRYSLLEVVGISRTHGIFRTNITNKYLSIDARSTFHHVKLLVKLELLEVKFMKLKPEGGSKPFHNVHVVFLKRFSPQYRGLSDNTQILCDLLSRYPQKTAPMRLVRDAVGKNIFKSLKPVLISSGVMEVVYPTPPESSEEECDRDQGGEPLLRLLRQPEAVGVEDRITASTGPGPAGDEDDSDYEENDDTIHGQVSLVAELPLEMQGYRLIDDCGSTGITMKGFIDRSFNLNRYVCRSMAKQLIKRESVSTLMIDSEISKVRTQCVISQRHLKENKDVIDFEAERAKISSQLGVQSALRTGLDVFHPKHSSSSSSSSSSLPRAKKRKHNTSEESTEPVAPPPPPSLDVAVPSSQEEGDEIREEEKAEFHVSQIKKFTKATTLTQLKRLNLIMSFMNKEKIIEGTIGLRKYMRSNEGVTLIDRKTMAKLIKKLVDSGQICKTVLNLPLQDTTSKEFTIYYLPDVTEDQVEEYKAKIGTKFIKTIFRKAEEVSSEDEDEENAEINKSEAPKALLPKFQRLKHLHLYLWILLHGFDPIESEVGYESVASIFLEKPFPWIQGVSQLPSATRGTGALDFCDILYHMPLSLLNIVGNVLPHMSSRYFTDPAYNAIPLHSLPSKLRRLVSAKNRDQTAVINVLDLLAEMNLVTLNSPRSPYRDTKKLTVTLNYSLEITDTTTAKPRHSFFLFEAKKFFPVLQYALTSIETLDNYWYKLCQICITTPIIIAKKRRGNSSNKALCDDFPLLHSKVRKKANDIDLNQQGFGAGGLPPSFFSHLSKNWTPGVIGTRAGPVEGEAGKGEELWEPGSRPKRKLGAKRQAHSGGRGLKRNRAKKALKIAHKVHQKAKENSVTLLSLIAAKGISSEDVAALSLRATRERSVWYSHEDNFILLAYLATRVLLKLGHPPTLQSKLRDALHKQFKSSNDKTVPAVHRRLVRLLKMHSGSSLESTINEILEEMGSMGSRCPDQNFESVLDFILSRYVSHDGHLINISLQTNNQILPSSLQELMEEYETPQENKTDEFDALTPKQNILLNIILATVGPDVAGIDSYLIYKLLESFPEADIQVVVNCLKSRVYVAGKKSLIGQGKGMLDNRGLKLGANLHQLFEGRYGKDFYSELCQVETSLLSYCEDYELPTESVNGGQVSSLISQMLTNPVKKNRFVCEPKFASPLLINDPNKKSPDNLVQLAMAEVEAGEEEEEEEEEETGEKRDGRETEETAMETEGANREGIEKPLGSGQALQEKSSSSSIKGRSAASVAKSGISTLLNIDESSHLQHGSLSIRPSVNIGRLLDPLEDEKQSSAGTATDTLEVSIQSFVAFASSYLGYTPVAIETARQVYAVINDTGDKGVAMETLLERFTGSGNQEKKRNFESILQDLMNFDLVLRVGTVVPLCVSVNHKRDWSYSLDGEEVPIRPWVQGEEAESVILQEFQDGVLSYIMSHPGITMAALLRHFKGILQCVSLEDILQNLLVGNCIKRYTLQQTTPTNSSPFSKWSPSVIRSCHNDDLPAFICYEALFSAEATWARQK